MHSPRQQFKMALINSVRRSIRPVAKFAKNINREEILTEEINQSQVKAKSPTMEM
jgi:hypothetical protein